MYDTFYFSRWFLQHRYVLYRGKGGNYMVAPARYAAVVGDAETGRQAMLDMPANTFLGGLSGVAASWGTSLSSLEKRMDRRGGFRPEEAGLRWQDGEALEGAVRFPKGKGSGEGVFPEAVFGEESEMLYLDLSPVLWRGTMPLHRYVRGRITDFTGGITKWNGKVRVYWKTDTKDFSKDRFVACDYINGKLLLPMGQIPGWRFENIRGLRIVLDGMPASLFLRLREVRFYRVKEA